MNNDLIIDFSKDFEELAKELDVVYTNNKKVKNIHYDINDSIDKIWKELEIMSCYSDKYRKDVIKNNEKEIESSIRKINHLLKDLDSSELRGNIKLSYVDICISIIAGILATLIDICLVGVPKNLFNKKNQGVFFDNLINQLGNNETIEKILLDLSKKCKVSYDVSSRKGIVYPKNHRLRCFAHDPLVGLFFAIFDIKMGTCTLIDNNGMIKIIPNKIGNEDMSIIMCIVVYMEHILSDVCTSQGIPVPGFVFTQFFNGNKVNDSFADICEKMYIDGYDLRHLASMAVPVFVKNIIIGIYYYFFKHENIELMRNISEKEIDKNYYIIYKYRLLFIADVIDSVGNVVKFFLPPNAWSLTAINLPEWVDLISDSIVNIKYENRNKTIEKILGGRKVIGGNWGKLFDE